MNSSLVPRLPDLFNARAREEGGAWDLMSRARRRPIYYIYRVRVGREGWYMVDRENCAWASAIFERSGSIRVKKKATLTVSEGSTILRGLAELRLIDRRRQTGLKSTLYGKASSTPFCQHLSRDFRSQALSRFFSCK